MNVRYLTLEDYPQWDKFVTTSPQGYIWDFSWWVDMMTKGDFKICALYDSDNLIVAGIVLPFFSTKRITSVNLTQSQGLLFEDFSLRNNKRLLKQLTNQKEYTKEIFDFIEKDFVSFDVNFHYMYDYWLPLFWRGYQQTTKYTYVIDYDNYVLEEEFKRFSKGHKWALNKVEKKSDLKVFETEDIEEYLRESHKTYERQGTKRPYTDEEIRKIHEEVSKRGMGKMLKIQDPEGRIHAIAYYLYTEKEVYYWLGASDAELRDSGGHTYLTWYAIKYFSDKVRFFNFGGSMIEYVERNFRNFSATPRQYFNISKISRGDKIRNILHAYLKI